MRASSRRRFTSGRMPFSYLCTAGWVAQWDEMMRDQDQKIARPRQIYIGARRRDYVPMVNRPT